MDLNGKNFLIIGGAGFIGSYIVKELLKTNVKKIVIFDNFSRGNIKNIEGSLKDSRVEIFSLGGDILQEDILSKACQGIDGVFHLAALWLLECHEFPDNAFNVNVRGTFNVLDACVKNNVKKLIFSSSASVYGDALYEPIDESHPFNNKNFYGATKICGEAMLCAYYYRYNLNYIGLRYMNVYGPGQDYKGAYIAVIMKMLDAIDNNNNPIIYGDGSEAFDFITAEDCAIANIKAMNSEVTNNFYNIGTGVKTTLKDLALEIIKLNKYGGVINYKKSSNSTLVKNRVCNPTKAENEIGFKYKTNLREGLLKLIKWKNKEINSKNEKT